MQENDNNRLGLFVSKRNNIIKELVIIKEWVYDFLYV